MTKHLRTGLILLCASVGVVLAESPAPQPKNPPAQSPQPQTSQPQNPPAQASQPQSPPAPYIDPRHLTRLSFGTHSHWLQPWRAYQETLPASKFLAAQGAVLDVPDGVDPDLIVQMLASHGIRNARIEIGWGLVNFFDEEQLNFADRFKALLLACKKNGVRPLILLNSNSGLPAPMDRGERILAQEAKQGDRQVTLTDANDLRAGYSGLDDLTGYHAGEVLFTHIEGKTLQLSKPLPKDLGKAGTKVSVTTFKYRPFAPPATEDYRTTMAGWKRYVGTVARFVAQTLGTQSPGTLSLGTQRDADRGFDLEIWNELTFGSGFLSINNYYEPKLFDYDEESIWRDSVRETADYVMQHQDDFRGVTLVDGFRNTIPWPASSLEPGRIGALSAHPYPPRKNYPADEPIGAVVNALFAEEKPGFKPTYSALFPEYGASGLQCETVIREMAPIETPVYETSHGRNARVFGGHVVPCPLWLTEMGLAPSEYGVTERAAAMAVKAKTTIRTACLFPAKGVERVYLFSALNGDTGCGLVRDSFAEYARTHHEYPEDADQYVSPALQALGRIAAKMKSGLDPNLSETRPLTIAAITDTHNHIQFQGDGTLEHPSLFNHDVLALLPMQVNRSRFVIPYYVMTRDVLTALPPEEYTVKIRGIDGARANVSSYDPIADAAVPVKVELKTRDELTVTLSAADYPYLLIIQEE